MRTALVHDWLTGMRGGEKCLEVFCHLHPGAPIHTLVHETGAGDGGLSPTIAAHPIRTSFLQDLPGPLRRRFRVLLPLFPQAIESFDLSGFDLVLSSSHCVAKGARAPDGVHLCYLFTPARYVWDLTDEYWPPAERGLLKRLLLPGILERFRAWDRAASGPDRVTEFCAISEHVRRRVQRWYERDARVIHPPVDARRFAPRPDGPDDPGWYLVASALVPYKRVETAVLACRELGRPLKVVGTGPEMDRLRRVAGPDTEFLGWVDDRRLADLYARCRAFLFPGEEDFGITPLEAMASGRPVIALGRGGALETVVGPDDPDGRAPTGLFFAGEPGADEGPGALADAIRRFEACAADFDPAACRARAEAFDLPRFRERIVGWLGDHGVAPAEVAQAGTG